MSVDAEKNKQARLARRKETGEDFTPPKLVNEILDQFPKEVWQESEKTWLDPTAGNGNFLVEIKRRLLEAGHAEEHILNNMIFGVDLMDDNCREMIQRLYGEGTIDSYEGIPADYKANGIKHVYTFNGELVPNIVCADGLEYDYSFGREIVDPKQALFDWNE